MQCILWFSWKKITKLLPEEGSVMILASLTFLFLNIWFDNWYNTIFFRFKQDVNFQNHQNERAGKFSHYLFHYVKSCLNQEFSYKQGKWYYLIKSKNCCTTI
jgi:hypothetical protein